MRALIGFRRLGFTTKLTVPFVCILVLAIALLGSIFVRAQGTALSRSLEKNAEILARNMATALSDPFAMGEYDLMQRIVEAAKKADDEVTYAIVVGMDGRGVASTDVARLLGIRKGAPVLEISRSALTYQNAPVELRHSLVNTQEHEYFSDLGKDDAA